MAASKKAIIKPAVKAAETAVKTSIPVTEEKKTEDKKAAEAPVQEEKAAAAVQSGKEEVKSVIEKAEAAIKAVGKKAPARKTAEEAKKTETKKAELKTELHVQFAGKSYSQEDLVRIARDVWKYDLRQKAGSLTSVELYVKPEENIVYYVMNKEFTGSFYI